MTRIPKIAESEWKVMKVLWSRSEPMPAYDIIQALSSEEWQPKTVKTLLSRLVKKRALGYRTYKNLYLYYPLVSEAQCVKVEGESFLKRCFGGNLEPMLAHFVEERRLGKGQIAELKRILDHKGR
jgi:BlaI family transcriptional regulator, penicillinase repressor